MVKLEIIVLNHFKQNYCLLIFPISNIVHDSNIQHLLFASLISIYPKTSFPSIFLSIPSETWCRFHSP